MNFPKPAVGMLPTDRLAYSAIPKRKALKLPKGARMAVWTITNVEDWDPTQTMPRTVLTPPAGGSPMPDIPNSFLSVHPPQHRAILSLRQWILFFQASKFRQQ